jgi:hypothetical protein
MTLSEGTSTDATTADRAASDGAAGEPVFSDLIDRWLREGDRLQDAAGPAGAPGATRVEPETWKTRARELVRVVLGRYRLQVLVGVGLVPLALLLLIAGRGAAEPPAPPAPAPVARVIVPPAPTPAAAPLPPAPPPPDLRTWAMRTPPPAPPSAEPMVVTVQRSPEHTAPKHRASSPRVAHAAPPKPAPGPLGKSQTAKPTVVAASNVHPVLAPVPGPGATLKPTAKPTFVVNPKVAPNLKLASSPARR